MLQLPLPASYPLHTENTHQVWPAPPSPHHCYTHHSPLHAPSLNPATLPYPVRRDRCAESAVLSPRTNRGAACTRNEVWPLNMADTMLETTATRSCTPVDPALKDKASLSAFFFEQALRPLCGVRRAEGGADWGRCTNRTAHHLTNIQLNNTPCLTHTLTLSHSLIFSCSLSICEGNGIVFSLHFTLLLSRR